MNDETWKPDWIEENRAAELNENRMEGILLPRTWSHTPARDMLNLQANEGSTFKGDLRLLFAGMCFGLIIVFCSSLTYSFS